MHNYNHIVISLPSIKCLKTNRILLSLIFILSSFSIPLSSSGQNKTVVDSLEKLLPHASGKEKVKILSDLCWEFKFDSSSKAIDYGTMALELSRELKYQEGVAQAYNDLGYVYHASGNFGKALDHYHRSLAIRKSLADTMGMASVLNKIGMLHKEKGNLKDALESFLEALRIYESQKYNMGISYLLNNIAVIFQLQRNYDMALRYQNHSLQIKEQMKDDYGVCGTVINMGSIYHLLKRDTLAEQFYKRGLALARKVNDPDYISQASNNLGSFYTDRGEYQKALPLLLDAYNLRQQMDDPKGTASSLINIGSVYRQMGYPDTAKKYLEEALRIAITVGAKQEIQNSYLNLSLIYETTGHLKKAIENLHLYTQMKDSIVNDGLNRQIAEMEAKYETEKKEKQIAQQDLKIHEQKAAISQRDWQIALLGGGVFFLLIIFYLLFRHQKLKEKQIRNLAVIEQQEQRIKAIIEGEENERKRLAQELHDGLGQILSSARMSVSGVNPLQDPDNQRMLQNTLGLLDRACGDLRNISHNLMPAALMTLGLIPALEEMSEKINNAKNLIIDFHHYGFSSRMDRSMETALYRIIQELINNVIKYANAKKVTLQLTRDENEITVTVEDDGSGFEPSVLDKNDGIGWKNIRSRVEFLKGNIHVDSQSGRGTSVTVNIPATA